MQHEDCQLCGSYEEQKGFPAPCPICNQTTERSQSQGRDQNHTISHWVCHTKGCAARFRFLCFWGEKFKLKHGHDE